ALRKSEAKLLQIIDTIPAQACRCLPNGSVDYLNRRWHDYTGVSREAALGWGWTSIIHPEDRQVTIDMWLHRVLPSGKPGQIEARLRRFDGEYRWFLIRFEPLQDEHGEIVNWYGTNTDIEELKRGEEAL